MKTTPENEMQYVREVRNESNGYQGTVTILTLSGNTRNVHVGDRVRVTRIEEDE